MDKRWILIYVFLAIVVLFVVLNPRKAEKPIAAIQDVGAVDGGVGMNSIRLVKIDGCEYLKVNAPEGTFTYTHKGNCKNHNGGF